MINMQCGKSSKQQDLVCHHYQHWRIPRHRYIKYSNADRAITLCELVSNMNIMEWIYRAGETAGYTVEGQSCRKQSSVASVLFHLAEANSCPATAAIHPTIWLLDVLQRHYTVFIYFVGKQKCIVVYIVHRAEYPSVYYQVVVVH